MSQRALLLAVRDHLRQELNLRELDCENTFDGRPLPMSGESFIAIHPGSWTNDTPECLDERYGIQITVTVRLPRVPQDRWGPELFTKAAEGLDALLEKIRVKAHMNYTLMDRANVIIGATGLLPTANGFIQPLCFRDGGQPMPKGPNWFAAAGRGQYAGLAQTLTFRDANRVQTIESMT